jgi:phenylpropionate dioxygenase-like ring-hydroxylating dioxygenase large terminal subunit
MGSAALRSVWHPVGYSADLADVPRAATLLDERVVLWRDAGSAVQCATPACRAALSLGA